MTTSEIPHEPVARPSRWNGVRAAGVVLGAVVVGWEVLGIIQTVVATNWFGDQGGITIPPLTLLVRAIGGAFLGTIGLLTALVSRPDGSRLGNAFLVGAVVLVLLGFALGAPWVVWTHQPDLFD